jgi:hypothetical protein
VPRPFSSSRLTPAKTPKNPASRRTFRLRSAKNALRPQGHRWSLAAFSLPPLGASVWPLVLSGLAMRLAAPTTLRCKPDEKPAEDTGRAVNWDSNAVLVYFAKF